MSRTRLALGLTLALIAALQFWKLDAIPLYSVGEPREAVEVVEEFDNGTWILPLRNGGNIPSKPPLFHWLGGLTALAVGRVDEWVVRFPSALIAAATLLGVAWFGAARWGAAAGLAAACILTTNLQWLKGARAARVDMTLTGCLTAAFLALAVIADSPAPPRLALAMFYIAMGLGTLAKGPVGIALPALTALLYLALRRDLARLRQMHVVGGMAVAIAIPATWYLLAIITGGMAFVHKQILRENIHYFLGVGSHSITQSHPIWYYGPAFAGGFAPWSVLLLPLGLYLWQNRRDALVIRPYGFPLIWFAAVIGFSVAANKRTNYILAAYPAAALMLGAWWSALWGDARALPPPLRRAVQLLVAAVAVATGAVVLMLLAHAVGLQPLEWIRPVLHRKDQQNLPLVRELLDTHRGPVAAWALSSVLACALLVRGARRERWAMVFIAIVVYVAGSALAVDQTFTLRIAQERTYKPFAAEVMRLAGESDRLFFYDTFDFGLVFYARRHIPVVRDRLPDAPAWLILSEDQYQRLPDPERSSLVVLTRSEGTGPEGIERYLLARR